MLELLADGSLPTGGGADGYQGYVSIATLVTGIAAFWRWIAPRLDKMFDVVPKMQELCAQNTTSLDELACATQSLAGNFGMLSRLVSATSAACMLQTKRVILLVEDSVFDSRLMMGILGPIGVKHRLIIIPVMTMDEALPQIPQACMMILDVNLPDSNIQLCRSLIEVCPCPVIVHSATSYTKADFPGARAIFQKGTAAEEIISVIDSVIVESKR